MEVNVLQSDMTEEMKKIISGFIVQGFKRKTEYEDISKQQIFSLLNNYR